MRKVGKSYAEISRTLGVSKSSLTRWLEGVEMSAFYKTKLLHGLEVSRVAAANAKRTKRLENTRSLIEAGKKDAHNTTSNLFLAGLFLYWAEGDKNKNERVKFTNSDEDMIRFMMKWFREECHVPESKFRIALHVHDIMSNNDPVGYWSKITGVDKKQFQKVYVKKSSLRQRRNVLYNGTCAIVVSDKALFRRMQGWRIGTLERFGICPRSSTDRTLAF